MSPELLATSARTLESRRLTYNAFVGDPSSPHRHVGWRIVEPRRATSDANCEVKPLTTATFMEWARRDRALGTGER